MRSSTDSRTNSITSSLIKRFSFRKSAPTPTPSSRKTHTQRISLNGNGIADPDALNYLSFPLRNPSSIRVLHLHHADTFSSPLHGTFYSVNLSDDVSHADEPYACLSYCWGSSERTEIITVDHKRLRITAQLRDALRRVREKGCRVIWADQICIDQGNVAEKNAQVRMMWEIYEKATWTFAYLGEVEGEDDEVAVECLKRMESVGMYREGQMEFLGDRLLDLGRKFLDAKRLMGSGPSEARKTGQMGDYEAEVQKLVKNICEIGHRPYFSRIWIVQELVRSGTDKLSFVLGSHTLSMGGLRALLACLRTTPHEFKDRADEERTHDAGARLQFLVGAVPPELDGRDAVDRLSTPISSLVYRFSTRFHCADPRDRFFALHGLTTDAEGLSRIDYSRSVRDVYIYYSHLIYKRNGPENSLLILSAGVPRTEQYDIPTWCLGRPLDGGGDAPVRYLTEDENACGPHKKATVDIDQARGILTARGSFVGEVISAPQLPRDFRIQRLHDSGVAPFIVDLCESLAAHYWQLWPIPKVRAYQVALDRIKLTFVPYVRKDVKTLGSEAELTTHPFFQVQQYSPDVNDPDWQDTFAGIFEKTFSGIVGEIIFNCQVFVSTFITKQGFVGFGCGKTQEGDFLAVLTGLKCPVILRPKGDMYQFLCRVNVGGIMEGEVFTQMKRELENIVLC